MPQKQAIYGYRLRWQDTVGDWVFVNEPGDNICVGLEHPKMGYQQYDSYEAYHLDSWVDGMRWDADMKMSVERCKFEFDANRMAFTKVEGEGYV